MAKRGNKNKIKRSCQKQSKQNNKKQSREKELYIVFQTLAPRAAWPGVPALPADAADVPHWGAGSTTCTGVGGGRWLQLRTWGAGNAPPKAAAPPAQPASPPGSLARSGQGQGRAGAQQLPLRERWPPVLTELSVHSVPSRRHLQRPPVSLVIPSPQGRTPSLQRWCGLLRSLQPAGAFSDQAILEE